MKTLTQPQSKYVNSIDYLRRKHGFTWEKLANEVGCTFPQLIRESQMADPLCNRQTRSGGGLSGLRRHKLAEVLNVTVFDLYTPAEEADKKFSPNIPK